MTEVEHRLGDHVAKIGEDSFFEGYVVAAFTKRNGKTKRYVVENEDGILHIAGPRQLRWMADVETTICTRRLHPDMLSDKEP